MRIDVDIAHCELHGQCQVAAPELFDFDDGDNLVWPSSADEEHRDAALRAAAACPVAAIRVGGPDS